MCQTKFYDYAALEAASDSDIFTKIRQRGGWYRIEVGLVEFRIPFVEAWVGWHSPHSQLKLEGGAGFGGYEISIERIVGLIEYAYRDVEEAEQFINDGVEAMEEGEDD